MPQQGGALVENRTSNSPDETRPRNGGGGHQTKQGGGGKGHQGKQGGGEGHQTKRGGGGGGGGGHQGKEDSKGHQTKSGGGEGHQTKGGGGQRKGGGKKSNRPPGDAPAKKHHIPPGQRQNFGKKKGENEKEKDKEKEKESRKNIGDEILQIVYRHRYLDLRQVTRSLHPTYRLMSKHKTRTTRAEIKKRLAILETHGLLERLKMPDRILWIATKMGQEEARKAGFVNRAYPTPRGVEALGYKHTFFVNEVGLTFMEYLENMSWKSWTHEEGFMLGQGREMVIPDAVLEYEDPNGKVHARFLEIDRNTEKVHILSDKIWDYYRYYHLAAKKQRGDIIPNKVWEQRFPFNFPDVIFVWSHLEPDQGWMRSVKLAEQMKNDRRYDKLDFHVLAGSAVHLDKHGPLSETALDLCHKGRMVPWVTPPAQRELGVQTEGELEPLTEEEAEEAALMPPVR